MEHQCTLITRSYECDSYGHVNNAVYLNYLEYARMEFLKAVGVDHAQLRAQGIGFVVVRICIDYRRQVRPGETLQVLTKPESKQRARVVFRQTLLLGQQTAAEAQVTWACINRDGRPVRLPPQLDIPELEP